jgi:hypothetical protein
MKRIQKWVIYHNIGELYNILSINDELSKNRLIQIINEFDLPIDIGEFFAPLGKSDIINFPDFCMLFRSKTYENNIFYKTFSSSFNNSRMINKTNNLFPITVIPK